MKKAWLPLMALAMVALLASAVSTEYEKGDYKIFALGDSEELTKEKYEYLVSKGEITPLFQLPSKSGIVPPFMYKNFIADVVGHRFNVVLLFHKDQLYQIYLDSQNYSAADFNTSLKNLMMERIKPMFEGIYGPPTIDYGYPDFFLVREGYVYFIAKWIIDDRKEIALRINPSKFEYSGEIIITDVELSKQKEKEEEGKERQKVLESAADF